MFDFIYVGDECDYTRYCVQDIAASLENVYCCMPPEYNVPKYLKSLCKFHNSSRFTSRGIKLPFRSIWKKSILDKNTLVILQNSTNLKCFIFTADGAKYIGMGALKYIRNRFPGCVTVCTFNDKVDLYMRRKDFNLNSLKTQFDYVVTYDKNDNDKYELRPCPPTNCNYSNVPEVISIPESDLFFVGRIKTNAPDRLKTLISIYEIAAKAGLKCDFYISGVPKDKQEYSETIHYNHEIPYIEVLKHVKRTKAVVNLSQQNVVGLTLRDFESIGMGKILITNNDTIKKSEFFNPNLYIPLSDLKENLERINQNTINNNEWKHDSRYDIRDWNNWIESLESSKRKNG